MQKLTEKNWIQNSSTVNKKKPNNIFEVDNSIIDKKTKNISNIKKQIISDKGLKEPKRIK